MKQHRTDRTPAVIRAVIGSGTPHLCTYDSPGALLHRHVPNPLARRGSAKCQPGLGKRKLVYYCIEIFIDGSSRRDFWLMDS
jgi:hypothetical protein